MAQTVAELAETVGASVDRLLAQMKDAGLPHAAAEEEVSEDDKQTLLAFLKKSHGESSSAPRKITLKRKQLSTLRTGGSGKRTVNVEVRKKRTYVKRDDLEEAAPGAEASELPATDVANAEAGLDAGPAAGEGLEAAESAVAAGVAEQGQVVLVGVRSGEASLEPGRRPARQPEEQDPRRRAVQPMERIEVLLQLVAHQLQRGGRVGVVLVTVDEQPAGLADRDEGLFLVQHGQRRRGLRVPFDFALVRHRADGLERLPATPTTSYSQP